MMKELIMHIEIAIIITFLFFMWTLFECIKHRFKYIFINQVFMINSLTLFSALQIYYYQYKIYAYLGFAGLIFATTFYFFMFVKVIKEIGIK